MIKIYGPYIRSKDQRKFVVLYNTKTKRQRSMNYARYLMEQHLGRTLESWEHVDHINGDCTDDSIENLQILTIQENSRKAIKDTGRTAQWYHFTCPVCDKESKILLRYYQENQVKHGRSGPYCSNSCSAKASAARRKVKL